MLRMNDIIALRLVLHARVVGRKAVKCRHPMPVLAAWRPVVSEPVWRRKITVLRQFEGQRWVLWQALGVQLLMDGLRVQHLESQLRATGAHQFWALYRHSSAEMQAL